MLQIGSTGAAVIALQNQLVALGLYHGAVDGAFGPMTKAAVVAFQKSRGLLMDGVVGPVTQLALVNKAPVPAGRLHGVDVSGYNPATQWDKVAAAGNAFASIKATEGLSYDNPYFSGDWRYSQSAGLRRGAYHYYRPSDDGEQQADHFLSKVGKFSGSLRPALDWETLDGVGIELSKSRALAFLEKVSSVIGVDPFIYFSAAYFDNYGDMSKFSKYPIWIAELGVSAPRIPKWWSTSPFWQYSWTGVVDGISAKGVDMDYFYGSTADLDKWLVP